MLCEAAPPGESQVEMEYSVCKNRENRTCIILEDQGKEKKYGKQTNVLHNAHTRVTP